MTKKKIKDAAKLLIQAAGGNKDVIRGIEAMRDLMLVSVEYAKVGNGR